MNRIVVPVNSDNRISAAFEKAIEFVEYETEDNQIIGKKIIPYQEDVVRTLKNEKMDAVICGMISDELRRDFALCGIALFAGVYGLADETVKKLLENTLDCEPDTIKDRHYGHYSPCSNGGEH